MATTTLTTDITTMTATDFATLSVSQLKALTSSQWGQVVSSQLVALPAEKVSALALEFISPQALTGISATALTSGSLAAINGLVIQKLSSAQIGALTNAQISALTAKKFANFLPEQLSLLNSTQLVSAQISELSAEQVDAFSVAQLEVLLNFPSLSANALSGLTTKNLIGLSAAKINSLNTDKLAALTPSQLNAIPSGLSDATLSALSPDTLKGFSADLPANVNFFTVKQITSLTPEKFGAFSTQQLQALTPVQAAVLRPSQVAELSSAKATALSSDAIAAIRPQVIKHIDLSLFDSTDIGALTPRQIAHLTKANVMQLTTANAGGLTATQIHSMKLASLLQLTTSARNVLSPEALEAYNQRNNAPKSSLGILVYETVTPKRDVNGNIVYSVNESSTFSSIPFSRVHYRMETTVNGTPYYADTSFDAWAGLTVADLAIPNQTSTTVFQRNVSNLTVNSNYPTVQNGSGFTGRLEIWQDSYLAALNAANNVGGSTTTFDFDDSLNTGHPMHWGSFQVHNLSATTPQTVLAWNGQGNTGYPAEIGFGNNPTGQPDWTFSTSPPSGTNGTSLGTTNWKLQIYIENGGVTVNEDTTKVFAEGDFGYSDPEGTPMANVKILSLPALGSLTYYNGTSDVAVTVNQVVSATDIATGKLKYTPHANANGTNYSNFSFAVSDGSLYSTATSMILNVDAVNDAPVFLTGTGIATTDISGTDTAYSSVLQPDGKIIVVGHSGNGVTMVRYNVDGSLDTNFATGGKFTSNVAPLANVTIRDVALQSDGKIVVTGSNGTTSVTARFTTSGILDNSFDSDGVITDSAAIENYAIAIQADGKIVTGGRNSSNQFQITRYNINGSRDNSFDTDGTKNIVNTGGVSPALTDLVIQSDGKIVAVGQNGANATFVAVRLNADGSMDSGFDGDGITSTEVSAGAEQAHAVAIQADGKILVAGHTAENANDAALIRYNSVGSLDTNFGTNGLVKVNLGGDDEFISVVAQNDGKILVAGLGGSGNDFVLSRYNIDGTLDTSFGISGTVTQNLSSGMDWASKVLVQNDGKIVVSGTSNSDFAVARYNSNGTFDNSLTALNLTIAENSSTTLYTVQTSDVDGNAITYSLSGTDASLLSINSSTGVLSLNAVADYETKNSYSFNILANDGTTSTTLPVSLQIKNMNDAPLLIQNLLTNGGAESGNLTGWTAVNGGNPWIASGSNYWEWAEQHSGNYSFLASYSAGSLTQEIDLIAKGYSTTYLDSSPLFNFGVYVKGCQNPAGGSFADTYRIKVDLLDANHTVIASYDSTQLAATNAWELKSGSFSNYGTGARYAKMQLLSVSDAGNWAGNYGVRFDDAFVTTPDAPVFTNVYENSPTNTIIYDANATDVDSTLTYSLKQVGDYAAFNINSTTGEVTLKNPADYETKNSYSFTVQVLENGVPSSVEQAVNVSVINLDNEPVAGALYNPATGHYYLSSSTPDTWQNTEAQAVAMGGHLVTVNNQAEQDWLVSTFGTQESWWIGYTDQATEGSFVWASGENSSYTAWNSAWGQPDNYSTGEDYALLTAAAGGLWADYGASSTLRGIIEIDPTIFTLTSASQNITGTTGNDTVNVGAFSATGTFALGSGTDTINATTGANISGINAGTATTAESLVMAGMITMTAEQYAGFSAITAAGTSDHIILTTPASPLVLNPNVEIFTLGNFANSVTLASTGQTVTGGTVADNIAGSSGNDSIAGGSGEDTISSGFGNDSIWGDAGHDSIDGGNGADTILGNAGNDTLYGGDGDDTFNFGTVSSIVGTHLDVVMDYTSNADLIGASGLLDTSILSADTSALVAGSNVQTNSVGLVTFHVNDDTYAERVAAIEADLELDAANSVALFTLGSDSYIYFSGIAAGNADDQIIKLSGVQGTGLAITNNQISSVMATVVTPPLNVGTTTFDFSTNPTEFNKSGSQFLWSNGAISIPTSADEIWTLNQAAPVTANNDTYTVSAFVHNAGNSGYGSLGFSTNSTNTSGGNSASPGANSFLGVSFHGGGGNFLNNGIGGSWSNGSDLTIGNWYKMVFSATETSSTSFSLKLDIYNATNSSTVGTLFKTHTATVTNANIANAAGLYPFFGNEGTRLDMLDNLQIELIGV